MPIAKPKNGLIGAKLFVLPYYGHGWSRVDVGAPAESMLDVVGPEPFDLRVEECVYCESEMVGITGAVIKPQEIFDGFWCCCLLRNTDLRDFTTHCGEYLVYIAKQKLEIFPEPYPKKALGDWVAVDKTTFCFGGYGTVAESADWLKDVYDRTMKGREEVKKVMLGRNQ